MTGQIPIAYVLDLIVGDPRWIPHPVVFMGKAIGWLEKGRLRQGMTRATKRLAGCVLAAVLVLGTWFLADAVLRLTSRVDPRLGLAVSVFLAFTTLATRSLYRETAAVVAHLKRNEIDGARELLAGLVGRDTEGLDDSEICRALVETVAENTSDGIVAPLFYLGIGGPGLALAYKAVNTLDSMVGYRTARYIDFGWASARLDDLANFIPARITALLTVVVATVLRKDGKRAWITARREGRNHESPNAGFPEAAMAGALQVRLGGPSAYFGETQEKPYIGLAGQPLSSHKVMESLRIMMGVSVAMVLAVVLVRILFLGTL
jgi:adenosylcobinamide-phosphate synthase